MIDFGIYSATPEILLLISGSLLLLGATCGIPQRALHYFAITMLIGVAVVAGTLWPLARVVTFQGLFVLSGMVSILKVGVLLSCAGVLAYSADYLAERKLLGGEYCSLAFFATLGMLLLISANNFILLYLGLELMSLSLYAMIAMRRDDAAAVEAAMKYFVLGALASGMLLYGISLLYGVSGSLVIPEVAAGIAAASEEGVGIVLALGLVFVVAGAAFKLGAAPFHMWLPDVYQGAPSAVTMFIGSAPKIVALAMMIRLVAESTPSLSGDWSVMLAGLSVVSLIIGNVVAIAQSSFKRMLAYSAIAHSGYVLLGVIAASNDGYAASLFYIFAYSLMTIGGFGMIVLLSRLGVETDSLASLRGLAKQNGIAAMLILILMLSMAGIPPVVGFYAKFAVISAVVSAGWVWLAVVAVIFSVVGAFYYLRVIKLMYFDEPEADSPPIVIKPVYISLAVFNGALIVLFGLFPNSILELCIKAVESSGL